MTQNKSFYARRKNEAYWGTPSDDNAAEEDLGKSDVKIYSLTVPKVIMNKKLTAGNYLNSGNSGFAGIRNDISIDKSGLINQTFAATLANAAARHTDC